MSVTIITHTQFGQFQTGSTLRVSPSYAQSLVNTYGANVRVVTQYPGTYWYQNGAVLHIYPRVAPAPVPVPTPTPIPNTINVVFFNSVFDPARNQTFQANVSYNFLISGLRALASRVGGLVFYARRNRNRVININDLERYAGNVIYADQQVIAFRGPGPVVVTPFDALNDDNDDDNNNETPNYLNANANNMLDSFSSFRSA